MADAIRSVLVVDDADYFCKLVELLFDGSELFAVVGSAGSGLEAIHRAGELQPDIVLLDLSLPDLDGVEAIPRILAVSPQSRIVMLSAHDADTRAGSAKEAGAAGYLVKDGEMSMLESRLAAALAEG